jgi:hypothetical protein
MEFRDLKGKAAVEARLTLNDNMACILRYVDAELLHRSMFLFYFAKDKAYIAEHYSFQGLLDKALSLLLNMGITDAFLLRHKYTRQDLEDIGWTDDTAMHWVEFAILLAPGVVHEDVSPLLPEVIAYHQRISLRMATHLQLTAEHIARISVC